MGYGGTNTATSTSSIVNQIEQKSTYMFLYGERDTLKICHSFKLIPLPAKPDVAAAKQQVQGRAWWRASVFGFGRVFVGAPGGAVQPSLKSRSRFLMKAHIGEAQIKQLITDLQLDGKATSITSKAGLSIIISSQHDALKLLVKTLQARQIHHSKPRMKERTSGILVRVTKDELARLNRMRSDSFEMKQVVVITYQLADQKPTPKRAHIWIPKQAPDFVRLFPLLVCMVVLNVVIVLIVTVTVSDNVSTSSSLTMSCDCLCLNSHQSR